MNVRETQRRRGSGRSQKKHTKIIFVVAVIGLAVIIAAALFWLLPGILAGSSSLTALSQTSSAPVITKKANSANSPAAHSSPTPYHDVRLEAAKAKNEDIIGWITIQGTNIDYPVAKTTDNKFYLTHDAEGKKSSSGTLFMDYRNDPQKLDGNNIIYGHHMKNNSMFSELINYKKKDFFDSHRVIGFSTPQGMTEWEVFSAYVTDTQFYYLETVFADKTYYLSFLKKLQEKSIFTTDCVLTENDDILTLSTCTYEFEDARFVVHARRIR